MCHVLQRNCFSLEHLLCKRSLKIIPYIFLVFIGKEKFPLWENMFIFSTVRVQITSNSTTKVESLRIGSFGRRNNSQKIEITLLLVYNCPSVFPLIMGTQDRICRTHFLHM